EMLRLQKNNDSKALDSSIQSLVLPNPDSWLKATFGDSLGKELADSYTRTRIELPLSFPDLLNQLQSKHMTTPRAVLFTDSCNPDSMYEEYPVLVSRTNAQPLYDVRLTSGTQGAVMRYFAY